MLAGKYRTCGDLRKSWRCFRFRRYAQFMAKVLDIDLDFFSWPAIRGPVEGRPPDDEYVCATTEQVRDFLENQCGLSPHNKLPGHFCERHDGAFDAWKQWLSNSIIEAGFEVRHIDAHSDVSYGDASWAYILTEHLALPLEHRGTPERGVDRLNEGSYLTFAIANRWISRLTYVSPVCPWNEYDQRRTERFDGRPGDLNIFLFKNQDFESGFIELLHLTKEDKGKLMHGAAPVSPISVEPSVPIEMIPANEFSSTGYTHMILAHSEEYCPETADTLIPVIHDYFYEGA